MDKNGTLQQQDGAASEEQETEDLGADGNIHVADDVIAALAVTAALEVPDLMGFSGGLMRDLTKMLGQRKVGRGVRIHREEKGITLDLFCVVRYGARIPRLAHQIQERVKAEVEAGTRLKVLAVNIHVQGIEAPDAAGAASPGGEA